MLKSLKNSLKRAKREANALPRALEAITKEYADARAKAGQTQYLVFVYTNELEACNKHMLSLNNEASARQALDKAEKDKEQPAAAPAQEAQ